MAAQDFMTYIATKGLFQMITGCTYQGWGKYIFNLMFCSVQVCYDLNVEDIQMIPLSQIDHFLVSFKLTGTPSNLCVGPAPGG